MQKDKEVHPLFYEFHKNQTGDKNNVLMHALGHWRISERFHDLAFYPAICVSMHEASCKFVNFDLIF